jgi:hypothetical protein
MGKCIFFLFLVDFGLHGIYSKELKGLTYIYCNIFYTFCTETTTILDNCAIISLNINIDFQLPHSERV